MSDADRTYPNFLGDGEIGALVPSGEGHALREALDALLSDPEKRMRLGRLARLRCEEQVDARKQFSRLSEHLKTVTAPASGSPRGRARPYETAARPRKSRRMSLISRARNPISSAG